MRSAVRSVAALAAALLVSGCVQGTDFVRDEPATPLKEGLYRFCQAEGDDCTPIYMFLDDDEYVYASRDGALGKARLREIRPKLFMAFNKSDDDFYGYGAVRFGADGVIDVFRFDCGRIRETVGEDALLRAGVFDAEPLRDDDRCRLSTPEHYAALAKLVEARLEDLSEKDGKFKLTLLREDKH